MTTQADELLRAALVRYRAACHEERRIEVLLDEARRAVAEASDALKDTILHEE